MTKQEIIEKVDQLERQRHTPVQRFTLLGSDGSAVNTLKLTIKEGHWWAEWMGDDREKVVGLFGTAVLPCPYQASVPFDTVAQSLRAANPGYMIVPPIPDRAWPRLHAAVDRLRGQMDAQLAGEGQNG